MTRIGKAAVVARVRAARAADALYLAELRVRGVSFGVGARVEGRPNVQLLGGAIEVGEQAVLRSRDFAYHGPIERVRLLVDAEGAVIRVGPRCRVNGAAIHAQSEVSIGADTYIASRTIIADSNGHVVDATRRVRGERDQPRPIAIGERVWIGFGVTILKGVRIGDDVVVAAGSVVTRDLPARTVCAGQPAKPVRSLDADP
jgi:acetyltransferase-like isoleucine patch superfamily enzyme